MASIIQSDTGSSTTYNTIIFDAPSSTQTPCPSTGPSNVTLRGTVENAVSSNVDTVIHSEKPIVYDENIAFTRRPRTEYDNIVNALSNVLLKYFVDKLEIEKCLAPEVYEEKSFLEEESHDISDRFTDPIIRNPSSESYDSEKERQENVIKLEEDLETEERARALSATSKYSRGSSVRLSRIRNSRDQKRESFQTPTTRCPSRVSLKSIKSLMQEETSSDNTGQSEETVSREDVNDADYFSKYKGRDYNVVVDFKNGNKYEGRISCFMMEGEGTYTWKDGTKFEGTFINGVAQGRGHFTWPDNSWYNGEVKNNLRHGMGICVIQKENGMIYYIGKWKEGKRHGSGIILFGEYDWYDGKWKNDKMHGRGLRQYPTGSRYLGEWRKGKPHGEGTMVWSQRDTYTGMWKEGKMHGRGTYTWRAFKATDFAFPLQNIYDGHWKHGQRHGMGRLLLASGAIIITKWVCDQKQGPGLVICKNGLMLDSPFMFAGDKLCNIGKPLVIPPWNKWYYEFLLPYQDGIVAPPETECESARVYDEYEKQIGHYSSKMPPLGNKRKGCLNNIPLLATVQTMPLWKFIEMSFEEEGIIKLENNTLYMSDETIKSMSFEELWLRKVLANRISHINVIYQHYAKLCSSDPPEYNCFLLRFMLWQMCLDCGIEYTSFTLCSLDKEIGYGSYPFDIVPVFQMIQYMLYLTYEICVKNKITNNNIPGLWGGALDYFVSNIALRAKSKENGIVHVCKILPISELYNIYIIIGAPTTMIRILQFFSLSNEEQFFESFNSLMNFSFNKQGRNIIYPDGSIVFEAWQNKGTNAENNSGYKKNIQDDIGIKEFASLGDIIIKEALFTVCSKAYEDPTIIYDYEVSFLEFCKFVIILLEEYKNITYVPSENNITEEQECMNKGEESIIDKQKTRTYSKKKKKHDLHKDGLANIKRNILHDKVKSVSATCKNNRDRAFENKTQSPNPFFSDLDITKTHNKTEEVINKYDGPKSKSHSKVDEPNQNELLNQEKTNLKENQSKSTGSNISNSTSHLFLQHSPVDKGVTDVFDGRTALGNLQQRNATKHSRSECFMQIYGPTIQNSLYEPCFTGQCVENSLSKTINLLTKTSQRHKNNNFNHDKSKSNSCPNIIEGKYVDQRHLTGYTKTHSITNNLTGKARVILRASYLPESNSTKQFQNYNHSTHVVKASMRPKKTQLQCDESTVLSFATHVKSNAELQNFEFMKNQTKETNRIHLLSRTRKVKQCQNQELNAKKTLNSKEIESVEVYKYTDKNELYRKIREYYRALKN